MTDAIHRSAAHGVFSLERSYPGVSARRVFDAFATEEGKAGWFSGPNEKWTIVEREFDFRPGGRERLVGKWANGMVTQFDCVYWDIIPGARIVYVYEMHLNGRKISVSLATIEFEAAGDGARLKLTEQGVFLDGFDDAGGRERGTNELMDRLGGYLARPE